MEKNISYKWHCNFFAKYMLLAIVILGFSLPSFAEFSPRGIPDSSDVRAKLIETWFEAPIDILLANESKKYTAKDGTVFEVRTEDADSAVAIIVAPQSFVEVNVYSFFDQQNKEMREAFPADSPGSWILYRDKASGKPLSIRHYFTRDNGVFVQITSQQKDRSNVDFIIFNMYAARNVPVRLPFSRFYSTSLTMLVDWTRRTLPWDYADIYTGIYHSVQQMIGMIRDSLPELQYKHDYMLDERENEIYVSTGKAPVLTDEEKKDSRFANRFASVSLPRKNHGAWNSSKADEKKIKLSSGGFAKWICDGLVMPIAGGGLLRNPLVVPTVTNRATSYQGILSQTYNLSFSLDWTRNLAGAVRAVESGRELRYPDSGVDVRIEPFNAENTPKGVSRVTGYIANAGYSVTHLKSLLFVLAVTNPGKWYLGALRETDKSVSPEVHVFNECIAFFPYFNDKGEFNCAVFANCEEIDFKKFVARFAGDFVNLTRINSSDFFFPTRVTEPTNVPIASRN